LDVLDEFDVGEKDVGGVDGLDQSVEEACDRVLESGSALALCDNGVFGQFLLQSGQ
jgi:hypothetical protein